MDRFEINNISGVLLVQRDNESVEGEKLADIKEAKLVCKGEVCGVNWKPVPTNGDINKDQE
jgi:hypothetical protein